MTALIPGRPRAVFVAKPETGGMADLDTDGDGYGGTVVTTACTQPSGACRLSDDARAAVVYGTRAELLLEAGVGGRIEPM